MKSWALPLLRCPATGLPLELREPVYDSADPDGIESGVLATADGRTRYPIVGGVPRFVPAANYAASFGLQWNRYRRTQLDSHSTLPISRERFFRSSGWSPSELAGRLLLDVGCGAGRFTEVALDAGARVIALDYSSAVDACRANHRGRAELTVVQGDVFHLPLTPGAFDFVCCFGVLQHTPDPARAFAALPPLLAPGGRLVVDVYPRLARNLFWSKYWLRPLTRRLPPERLFALVERWTPPLLRLSRLVTRVPALGRRLRYLLPVANYGPDYPLSEAQLAEWAVLDTFDMLAPAHDRPQSLRTVQRWFVEAGLEDVDVRRSGFHVGRGRRSDPVAAARPGAVVQGA
jgi:SAM-dependent methyltransferase